MAGYRSRSHGGRHIEVVKGNEFSSQAQGNQIGTNTNNTSGNNFSEIFSKHGGNNDNNGTGHYNGGKNSRSKSAKSWSLSDPEVKRRKRVASYKVYSVEGKMKASFLKSFRWIKDKYSGMVQGW